MNFCEQVLEFYTNFTPPMGLNRGIALNNPFTNKKRRELIKHFYNKFYYDENARLHILGINPSRMNNTSTGVNYSDGFSLEKYCGIKNDFSKSRELTSDFFYRVVNAMGGADNFFNRSFPWAMMPVTVTKEGRYTNYYDKDVIASLSDIVTENVRWISRLPSTGRLVILGTGDNKKHFEGMAGAPFGYNDVQVLPHPRWIMQYNREKMDYYIDMYLDFIN